MILITQKSFTGLRIWIYFKKKLPKNLSPQSQPIGANAPEKYLWSSSFNSEVLLINKYQNQMILQLPLNYRH